MEFFKFKNLVNQTYICFTIILYSWEKFPFIIELTSEKNQYAENTFLDVTMTMDVHRIQQLQPKLKLVHLLLINSWKYWFQN